MQCQATARLDNLVNCRPHSEDGKRLSEIALGIDAFGSDRPAWPQSCGHGTDSADVVLNGAVVGDMDAAAWVADSRLKAKPEPLGLIDGLGDCPKKKDQGCDRDGDSAEDSGPVSGCIQHDHPVRLGECRPAVALVACIRECHCRWPAWCYRVCLASCSGFNIVGRSATPTVKLLINYTLCLAQKRCWA